MGLDPTSPEMTLLLVMLHTGTMFSVIVYFWKNWKETYFSSTNAFKQNSIFIFVATAATGIVGLTLIQAIKYFAVSNAGNFEIEHLFGNARLMAAALAAAGVLIIFSSRQSASGKDEVSLHSAVWIGVAQGICLPFRGFSRSGATISSALALHVDRRRAEQFSFALAVVLTPAVIIKEAYRIYLAYFLSPTVAPSAAWDFVGLSLLGMVLSFFMGLVALRWLSNWLEQGRWHFFGIYCMFAAMAVLWVG